MTLNTDDLIGLIKAFNDNRCNRLIDGKLINCFQDDICENCPLNQVIIYKGKPMLLCNMVEKISECLNKSQK